MSRRTILVVGVLLALAVVLAWRQPSWLDPTGAYTAELPDAAGIRAGDDVRVSGVAVGEVTEVAARGDRVYVGFELDQDVPLTADTRTEVKLASLLGERYLQLTPGRSRPLPDGGGLPLANAFGSYTLERFWLDNSDTLGRIDLEAVSRAVDVLSTDLNGSPRTNQAALDGLTALARTATKRDQQVGRLLASTRAVTDEVVAQRRQLTSLMTNADQVFAMVADRKAALDALLRDSRALVLDLTAMARRNQAPVRAALRDLRTILATLTRHRDDLARTLELADPAMRLYVNSAGDGPWLGVNAPYFTFPDSWWCTVRNDIGC